MISESTFGEGNPAFSPPTVAMPRAMTTYTASLLPEIKITISGYVVDKDDEPVPNAIIRIVGDDGSNQKEVARDDGSFKFNLDRGVKYVMLAGAKGYLNVKQEFEFGHCRRGCRLRRRLRAGGRPQAAGSGEYLL